MGAINSAFFKKFRGGMLGANKLAKITFRLRAEEFNTQKAIASHFLTDNFSNLLKKHFRQRKQREALSNVISGSRLVKPQEIEEIETAFRSPKKAFEALSLVMAEIRRLESEADLAKLTTENIHGIVPRTPLVSHLFRTPLTSPKSRVGYAMELLNSAAKQSKR